MRTQAQSVCLWHALPFHPPKSMFPLPASFFPNSQHFHSLAFPEKISHWKPCSNSNSNSNDPILKEEEEEEEEENSFFDEDGVVQDMDGYLNYLSLEYDSVWDTKPSWCQPWTITLTGVVIITSSWLLLHSTVITATVLTLVFLWWFIFLYSYPKAYSDMIAERRKKVTSGHEDTYGVRQSNKL